MMDHYLARSLTSHQPESGRDDAADSGDLLYSSPERAGPGGAGTGLEWQRGSKSSSNADGHGVAPCVRVADDQLGGFTEDSRKYTAKAHGSWEGAVSGSKKRSHASAGGGQRSPPVPRGRRFLLEGNHGEGDQEYLPPNSRCTSTNEHRQVHANVFRVQTRLGHLSAHPINTEPLLSPEMDLYDQLAQSIYDRFVKLNMHSGDFLDPATRWKENRGARISAYGHGAASEDNRINDI